MTNTVAKSGWLYRQSSILKKWKRNWFVLYADGYLRYFENETSLRAEDVITVPVDVIDILTGWQVEGVQPPAPLIKDNLLMMKMQEGKSLVLCADSPDDMKAWQLSLAQARFIHPQRPYYQPVPAVNYPIYGVPSVTGSYPVYPGQSYIVGPRGGYAYQAIPGQNMVIIDRSARRYHGTDVAMGMMAGAALGTMMWAPLWWC